MDIFVKFNRKSIDDRQIDTLIGLSKGMLSDGHVNAAEARYLHQWLTECRTSTTHPIVLNLLAKVEMMLADGKLDPEEEAELHATLRQVAGEPSEFGEVAKSTTLPLCSPVPQIEFDGRSFLFTGTCAYGTRKQCQDATERLGGTCAASVIKTLDYLVIGSYVTDSWVHETFGRKIGKAMQYRDDGAPLSIVSEAHWASSGRLL
jgi:NAD-dependent DNA ligase